MVRPLPRLGTPAFRLGPAGGFGISDSEVSAALTGPEDRARIETDLEAVRRGQLATDELAWTHEFAEVVPGSTGIDSSSRASFDFFDSST